MHTTKTAPNTDWRAFRRLGRGLAAVGLMMATIGLLPHVASAADPAWDPADNAALKTSQQGSSNPGFTEGDCPTPPEGAAGDWGWHFVLPGNSTDFVTIDVDFESYGFHLHVPFVADPSTKHAYVYTPGPDTLLNAKAVVDGTETEFVLSHVCPGTTATTTTTVPDTTTTTEEVTTTTEEVTTTTEEETTTTTVPEETTTTTEEVTTTTAGGGSDESSTTVAPSVSPSSDVAGDAVLGNTAVRADALPRTGSSGTSGLLLLGMTLLVLGCLVSHRAKVVLNR